MHVKVYGCVWGGWGGILPADYIQYSRRCWAGRWKVMSYLSVYCVHKSIMGDSLVRGAGVGRYEV